MRRHLLTIAVILAGAPGCDNVAFGEAHMEVVPPPVTIDTTETVEESDVAGPENIHRPVLLAGLRDGLRATLTVVGEVDGDVLRPFPHPDFPDDTTRLAGLVAPGSEWTLFSEGVRVGRLVTESAQRADTYCGTRVTISGVVEVVPTAATAERLLALPALDGSTRDYGAYEELAHVYDQRVASLEIAQEAIPANNAVWPRLGVLDARQHIQAFDLSGTSGPFVAATFMYQDSLAVTPPGQGAYALFVIGEQVGASHQTAYVWYRAVDTDGKGAPRYFDHLDWDGDGDEEILLDVFGSNRRWFAGLTRRSGSWERTFQDACGTGAAARP
jgi:hypothetical protein